MEGGKNKPAYTDACGIIEIDPVDIKRLGVYRNTNVRVTSDHGTVVVKAVEATQGPHPGLAYIPMGAWANAVVDPNTYGMGMPTFKGTPIQVSVATNEPVLGSVQARAETRQGVSNGENSYRCIMPVLRVAL